MRLAHETGLNVGYYEGRNRQNERARQSVSERPCQTCLDVIVCGELCATNIFVRTNNNNNNNNGTEKRIYYYYYYSNTL